MLTGLDLDLRLDLSSCTRIKVTETGEKSKGLSKKLKIKVLHTVWREIWRPIKENEDLSFASSPECRELSIGSNMVSLQK